jgi:hypothetical protein
VAGIILDFLRGGDHVARTPVRLVTTDGSDDEVVGYCPRPKCRKEFRQVVGRGRPRTYCSDECRRLAEAELRTLNQRLRHYRSVVEQLQVDVASFGRTPEELADNPMAELRTVEDALIEAKTALRYLDEADPTAETLKRLYESVDVMVRSPNRARSAS